MAQSISARIYEAFFERLASAKEVRQETLAALRRLYSAGWLESKPQIKRLTQEMEERHAQDQDAGDQVVPRDH